MRSALGPLANGRTGRTVPDTSGFEDAQGKSRRRGACHSPRRGPPRRSESRARAWTASTFRSDMANGSSSTWLAKWAGFGVCRFRCGRTPPSPAGKMRLASLRALFSAVSRATGTSRHGGQTILGNDSSFDARRARDRRVRRCFGIRSPRIGSFAYSIPAFDLCGAGIDHGGHIERYELAGTVNGIEAAASIDASTRPIHVHTTQISSWQCLNVWPRKRHCRHDDLTIEFAI